MSNCIGPTNITPNSNQVILQDVNQTITIVNNECCTDVTVTQPITNIVEIRTPGIPGPQGPQGTGGSTPGGLDTYIQYNSGNTFAGSPNFIFDYNTNSVLLTGSLTVSSSNTFKNIGPAQFTGSVDILGPLSAPNITGSLFGTSSWAISSSRALSASWAPTIPGGLDQQIQFNSGSVLSGSVNFIYVYESQSLQQGYNVIASGQYSHAEGSSTQAIGYGSHAEGQNTQAVGPYSHAEGTGTQAVDSYSHAEGASTQAIGQASHAEGQNTQAIGPYSHAEGIETQAIGSYSHVEGQNVKAGIYVYQAKLLGNGVYSILNKGDLTSYFIPDEYLIFNDSDFAGIYGQTTFQISQSYVAGADTTIELYDTSVYSSNAYIGPLNININIPNPDYTLGDVSHAEGQSTQAIGQYSHAEGANTQAIGNSSHAEGANTQAIGDGSHAEGFITKAIGPYSHAEGIETQAIGQWSHAEGYNTIASGSYQTVVGQYNTHNNTTDLFVVGGGDNDANRKDILAVSTTTIAISGSVNISGSLNAYAQVYEVTFLNANTSPEYYSSGDNTIELGANIITNSNYTRSTNTITVNSSGLYKIYNQCKITTVFAGDVDLIVYINGNPYRSFYVKDIFKNTTTTYNFSCVASLNTSDTIEFHINSQNSFNLLATSSIFNTPCSYMTIEKLN